MKNYIILTVDIHPIGGMQLYVSGKAKYLEKNGWRVNIFFDSYEQDLCKDMELNKYLDGNIPELELSPAEFPKFLINRVLKKMVQKIGETGDEIIIESQSSSYALWGELLAKKLKAKHFCFLCNEEFRSPEKYYDRYIDFFDFKHKRRELAGIHQNSCALLFEGYKDVSPSEALSFTAKAKEPVQDVLDHRLDAIKQADYTICYIGRINKGYVPNILDGVCEFAKEHRDNLVQMVFVGDVTPRMDLIREKINDIPNLRTCLLGDLVPIPRELFSRIDVVIAGSGCALCSAREGIATIVADAQNYKSNGILGVDTNNPFFVQDGGQQFEFSYSLKKVLVDKVRAASSVAPEDTDSVYAEHFKLINNSDQLQEYYCQSKLETQNVDVKKILLLEVEVFKIRLKKTAPKLFQVLHSIRITFFHKK